VNGRLGMTLVARDIFPTLLEDAREILTQALTRVLTLVPARI
jgi:hypothetical protein